MSLEEALNKNTASTDRLAEVIMKQNAIMEAAVTKVGAKVGTAAAPAAATTTTEAAVVEKKGPGRPKKVAETAATETPKTPETARTLAGAWIKEGGDAGSPEYEGRKATVSKLNTKHGVAKISELKPDQAAAYIEDLEALGRGEEVFEDEAAVDPMDDI